MNFIDNWARRIKMDNWWVSQHETSNVGLQSHTEFCVIYLWIDQHLSFLNWRLGIIFISTNCSDEEVSYAVYMHKNIKF